MREFPAEDKGRARWRAHDESRGEGLLSRSLTRIPTRIITRGPWQPTAFAGFGHNAVWHDVACGLLPAMGQRPFGAKFVRHELRPTIRHRPEGGAALPWRCQAV